jgi:nucleoside-diphosphate-sugar epimerase
MGQCVLVTGATGFIGGRLVERLIVSCGAQVRALVRRSDRAARLARLPADFTRGDILVPEDVARAAKGCGIIFHCAYGTTGPDELKRAVNVDGTRNVLEAARKTGVRRVVHFSTVMVYGTPTDGELREDMPRRHTGDPYGDSKLEAEIVAFEYATKHNLAVSILQPTIVYGPFSTTWTVNILEQLKTTRQILVNGGTGLCNAVYVDDVVSAALLAAVKREAVGQAFLVSGSAPVTWREFFGRFDRMLGTQSCVYMSAEEALAFWHRTRKGRPAVLPEFLRVLREDGTLRQRLAGTREVDFLRHVGRRIVPPQMRARLRERLRQALAPPPASRTVEARPIRPLHPRAVAFYAARTAVRIDKARALLGYEPAFDFESGMDLTERWIRWANLIDNLGAKNRTDS